MKNSYVYIVTNKYKRVYYIGVTSNLEARITNHREGIGSIFTAKYNCKYLLWYEHHSDIQTAIAREKQLKNWKREWKEALVREMNPELRDLYEDFWQKVTATQ